MELVNQTVELNGWLAETKCEIIKWVHFDIYDSIKQEYQKYIKMLRKYKIRGKTSYFFITKLLTYKYLFDIIVVDYTGGVNYGKYKAN